MTTNHEKRMKVIRCTIPFTFFLLLIMSSCLSNQDETKQIATDDGIVTISVRSDKKVNYLISQNSDSVISQWPLRFPVFRWEIGDVDNDGQDDIAVGVIKKTRYDSVERKRLFLFELKDRVIIPLWLGSSLGRPLHEFTLINEDGNTLVRSIQIEASGKYLVADYEWLGFGLSFLKYHKREVTLREALAYLDE